MDEIPEEINLLGEKSADSFSHKIKTEITAIDNKARHCRLAELAALINSGAAVKDGRLCFHSEGEPACQRFHKLAEGLFGKAAADGAISAEMLDTLGIGYQCGEIVRRIGPLLVGSDCCKRAYIRGAFLASGSSGDPLKTYHLEFVSSDEKYLRELSKLINQFGLQSKIVQRKSHFVCYLKEGEQIADLLNIIGAHERLMELENTRIVKDLRNGVNRIVNCETANINKTAYASAKHVEDIEYIEQSVGLSSLPEHLAELAELRCKYPEMTLSELGAALSTKLGKSGVNHRLRKISETAQNLRDLTNLQK